MNYCEDEWEKEALMSVNPVRHERVVLSCQSVASVKYRGRWLCAYHEVVSRYMDGEITNEEKNALLDELRREDSTPTWQRI